MALLSSPKKHREAIVQDYRDKHAGCGSVLVCRKYPKQIMNNEGQYVFDSEGRPVMRRKWYEARFYTATEYSYEKGCYTYSESRDNDVYATLNAFPVGCKPVVSEDKDGKEEVTYRAVEKLGYLTGFYLDIDHKDIHELAKSKTAPIEMVEEALGYKEQIVDALRNALESDYGMPVVTFTGGGYGLYFKLVPLEANEENKALYMGVWEALYKKINEILGDIMDVFENDHSVLDFVRVIRVTGTYNSKSGMHAEYVCRYGNAETNEIYAYGIDELFELYGLGNGVGEADASNSKKVSLVTLQKEREEKGEPVVVFERQDSSLDVKQSLLNNLSNGFEGVPSYIKEGNLIKPTKWYTNFADVDVLKFFIKHAEESLEYLDNSCKLHRNDTLFLLACLKTELEYTSCDYDSLDDVEEAVASVVIDYVASFNESFSTPVDSWELEMLLASALQNKYHFRKHETMQRFLNLEDAEYEELGWLDVKRGKEESRNRNKEETKRDKEIVRLFLSGLSDAKVAEALGISKLKCIRTRKRLGVKDRSVKFEDIDFYNNRRHSKSKNTQKIKKIKNIEVCSEKENASEINNTETETPCSLNNKQQEAYDYAIAGRNLLLTGSGGGVGKTWVLNRIVDDKRAMGENVAVCAATAVAANHIGGETFHHLFGIHDNYRNASIMTIGRLAEIDCIVIDEAAMITADDFSKAIETLEKVEELYEHYVQLIISFDVLQLPPVNGKYFFKARRLNRYNFSGVYLDENVRQSGDLRYTALLNKLRINEDIPMVIDGLNNACCHGENPNNIYLVPHVNDAKDYNLKYLSSIPGDIINLGNEYVKIGAKVIVTENSGNKENEQYFNGMMGTVTGFSGNRLTILTDNGLVTIKRRKRKNRDGSIKTYYPVALGKAITIHKAQGMTLDSANIDPAAFAPGQLYTALSRIRTASGVNLLRDIDISYVIVDSSALAFDAYLRAM